MRRRKILSLNKLGFNADVADILHNCKEIIVPKSNSELFSLTLGTPDAATFDVSYDVGGETVKEVTIVRCKNGVAVNYTEDYMRRRDPNCLLVADELPSDKPRYKNVYKNDFWSLREDTFNWLKDRELLVVPFLAGGAHNG